MRKKVSLEGIYENNGESMIMFAEDGIMLKGNKSDFIVKLEGPLEGNTTTIDQADAVMIDTSY